MRTFLSFMLFLPDLSLLLETILEILDQVVSDSEISSFALVAKRHFQHP